MPTSSWGMGGRAGEGMDGGVGGGGGASHWNAGALGVGQGWMDVHEVRRGGDLVQDSASRHHQDWQQLGKRPCVGVGVGGAGRERYRREESTQMPQGLSMHEGVKLGSDEVYPAVARGLGAQDGGGSLLGPPRGPRANDGVSLSGPQRDPRAVARGLGAQDGGVSLSGHARGDPKDPRDPTGPAVTDTRRFGAGPGESLQHELQHKPSDPLRLWPPGARNFNFHAP